MKQGYLYFVILFITSASILKGGADNLNSDTANTKYQNLSLNDCIKITLQNSSKKKAANYLVEIANQQYKQSLSGYWPEIDVTAFYSRSDEDPNFIFPSFQIPAQTMDIGGTSFNTPELDFPEMEFKLFDKQSYAAKLKMQYPIYTGGKISSYIDQAEAAIEFAEKELTKSTLSLIRDVKKCYYSLLLANTLYDIGKESLTKLNVTLNITKNVYENGSGKIKKTDYLKAKLIVENVNAEVISTLYKIKQAESALKLLMGLERNETFSLIKDSLRVSQIQLDFNRVLNGTLSFNPDISKLNASQKIFEAKINEAKSGHLPSFAITGSLQRLENSYDYGLATSSNKTFISVGIGVELPIFKGFRTEASVAEAEIRLEKFKEEKIFFTDGITALLDKLLLELKSTQDSYKLIREAYSSSVENLDLTERAYQIKLLDEKDLLEAQIIEALMRIRLQKKAYDFMVTKNEIDFIVGSEVERYFTK